MSSKMIKARNKVLHVCCLDKFIPPFIDFIEENFDDFLERHVFYIGWNNSQYHIKDRSCVFYARTGGKINLIKDRLALAKAFLEADKIILHGLFIPYVVHLLAIMPWVLPKCYWVMWGGDLYVYQLGEKNRQWKQEEFYRRIVIKRIGYLVTYVKGDYQLAKRWYGARGKYCECLTYPSNLCKNLELISVNHSGINILIGNSSDPSNNHIEIFDKLQNLDKDSITVYAPLSYGDQHYAKLIIAEGRIRFGENFIPITTMMQFKKYLEFLGTIDIAIFNHKRQQAMGNTITLLGLGKKIYLRSETTQWDFLLQKGFKVFDSSTIETCPIDPKSRRNNEDRARSLFSEENLKRQLSNIFN